MVISYLLDIGHRVCLRDGSRSIARRVAVQSSCFNEGFRLPEAPR
jgi:hypothetical protein